MTEDRPHDGFLTKTHRKVLRGEYEGAKSTQRSHKQEIRKRTKAALGDLITVANSPHISNESEVDGERLFEPEDLNVFLSSVVSPGGLAPPADEFPDSPHAVEQPSEAFQNEVYVEVDKVLWSYRHDDEYGRGEQTETSGDTPTKCRHCGYEWEYSGDKSRATCPDCGRKTESGGGHNE